MPALPVVSGGEVVRAFQNAGWLIARQRGSHIVMIKEGGMVTLSVPNHDSVAKGTLRSLVRDAGLTVDQFIEIL
jgi:predicted RNA binding protein YcfA (HicA-like mRNA interferase family)